MIVAAATVVEAVRAAVTTTSAVADEVSPALRIDVAFVATVEIAALAVTVIVNVCAVALSEPPPATTAGVSLTT